jgi:hypothetical protein
MQEGDISPIEATLVEGYSVEYDVDLVYSHGESKFLITTYYNHILDQEFES